MDYQKQWEHYAEKVDTPQPVEQGDSVEVSQLAGVYGADYPVTGTVIRVTPRGFGDHKILADWFVKVKFDEDEPTAVHGATTERFFVGRNERSWDELPIKRSK